jgi:hypothetical protein
MGHNGCLMFCQITADEERRGSQCIVVVQHPSLVSHNSGLFCAQHASNMLKLPGTTVYHLTTWYKFMIDNAFPIKKYNHHHLHL